MMKRPQKNLLVLLSVVAVPWVVLRELPLLVTLAFTGLLLLLALVLMVIGRDFLVGRYYSRKREWRRAMERYSRFERRLLTSRVNALLIPLYLGIYSFDGVAITRNNIAHSLMNLGELDEAVRWLRMALQRDPLYAVPYTNLGTIAAMRNDRSTAQVEFRRAVELGFSPTGAQELLRRALAKANSAMGRTLE
jgi:tetratricopeptide (TPR) repeat protein